MICWLIDFHQYSFYIIGLLLNYFREFFCNFCFRPFFQFVDGIFLNYNWKLKDLAMAKKTAGPFRRYDVFVGVDVFGRGCYGGGGWNTAAALEVIRQHDMSVAMFAPGWVLECNASADFLANQNRFWSAISPLLPQHGISRLPIETSFCIGFGRKKYRAGAEEIFDFAVSRD